MDVIVRQKIRGKGNPWWVFISHNGTRTSKLVGDKRAAMNVASEVREKIKMGEFRIEKKEPIPLFRDYAQSWMKTTVPATCKESTMEGYDELLREGGSGSENDPMASRVGGRNQNWAPLALAGGKLLLRDQTQLKCLSVAQ